MAEEIDIRLVHSWDEEEIAALYRAGGWWKEDYRTEDLRHLMRGSYAFAVAAENKTGRAVGMGRVISDGISDGYIQDLVVLPEFRKSGVGAQIVAALINRCLQAGITWIALIAEPGTERFYLPFGFHPMEGYVPLLFRGEP
ncbi:MAG TPA: GNAT family N-acetyltransferase [Methanoregula sp.]|nr:GNAT family N-acetyltransferase [Methanoregula sp.]